MQEKVETYDLNRRVEVLSRGGESGVYCFIDLEFYTRSINS